MNSTEYDFFSKKNQRALPLFTAEKLLYDYATGSLDRERSRALEKSLALSPELKAQLAQVRLGMAYAEELAKFRVHQELSSRIDISSGFLQTLAKKIRFEDWPQGLRLGLESLVVVLGIASISILVPWHKVMELRWENSKQLVLTELSNSNQETETEAPITAIAANEAFPDEEAKPVAIKPTPAPKQLPEPVEPTKPQETSAVVVAKPNPESSDSKRQGYLYRGSIEIANVEASNPKLVEKISELGGRKAGEVPIGWRKGSGSYFHFTIPESKYESVLQFFNEYGQLKIQRELHDRVMPDGIIRIIIQVDEKPNEPATQAPE